MAVAAALAVASCGSDDGGDGNAGGSTQAAAETTPAAAGSEAPTGLVKAGAFTSCTDPSYAPFEYYNEDKQLDGFDIAVASQVAEGWGLQPAFHEAQFAGLLPALDAGRCDVVWSSLFLDPERTKSFAAIPYQETASVILVQGGNPEGISSPDDLSGKTVASENGSNLLKKAQTISKDLQAKGKEPSNVQGYEKFSEAIQQLLVGRADAVITQDVDASFRELAHPGKFEVAYKFPDAGTIAIYYRPDDTELGEKLHQALTELEQSGELERIAKEEGMPADGISIQAPVGG